MLIKIRLAFTGFVLSFKMSLITNRTPFTVELITGAREGLITACIERLVYNWGPYKLGGGGLIIGCYGGNDRLGSSIIKREVVFWVFAFHDLVD